MPTKQQTGRPTDQQRTQTFNYVVVKEDQGDQGGIQGGQRSPEAELVYCGEWDKGDVSWW